MSAKRDGGTTRNLAASGKKVKPEKTSWKTSEERKKREQISKEGR